MNSFTRFTDCIFIIVELFEKWHLPVKISRCRRDICIHPGPQSCSIVGPSLGPSQNLKMRLGPNGPKSRWMLIAVPGIIIIYFFQTASSDYLDLWKYICIYRKYLNAVQLCIRFDEINLLFSKTGNAPRKELYGFCENALIALALFGAVE